MKYKAFEDFYKESNIKNLVLTQYGDALVSPPFATERCKDYSTLLYIKDNNVEKIELDLPPATSKFNGVAVVDDSLWMIPYGIWDQFNIAVQLKSKEVVYHQINEFGKGQFYWLASGGNTGFSFPLGYEGTNYSLLIKDGSIKTILMETSSHKKKHMGTVFCNNSYWSPPRGDDPGYTSMLEFNGEVFKEHNLTFKHPEITRKYSDLIAYGDILYGLPFGEERGLKEVIEFDTNSKEYCLHNLNMPDFKKKYNCGVLLEDTIVSLPYGDEHDHDSNWGLSFNIKNKSHHVFDIGYSFGGKWRFRSGINFKNNAVFFPTGTPSLPIISFDSQGKKVFEKHFEDYLIGRPIEFDNFLYSIAYNLKSEEHYLMRLDQNYKTEFTTLF